MPIRRSTWSENSTIFLCSRIPRRMKPLSCAGSSPLFQLRQLGFENVSITPFDWLHPAMPQALIEPVRKIGKLMERAPLVREFSVRLYINARRPEK